MSQQSTDHYFRYHDKIIADFPLLVGGVITAQNLTAAVSPSELAEQYQSEQQSVLANLSDRPLSEIPSIYGWRRAFRKFGANPTKYRSAAEALLRRLTKKGDIPHINLLVDIANLISIRYALPVAVFDTIKMDLPLTVRYSDGSEQFVPLGSNKIDHPLPGEVIFADEQKHIAARRWCWRQSAHSAATPQTHRAVVTVEAQHQDGRSDVELAVNDLVYYLAEYASAECKHTISGS